jgi:hypothetical protein
VGEKEGLGVNVGLGMGGVSVHSTVSAGRCVQVEDGYANSTVGARVPEDGMLHATTERNIAQIRIREE